MAGSDRGARTLDRIERVGNALPHPATLFALALAAVIVASQIAAWLGWSVTNPAAEGEPIKARGLLSSDGVWWLFDNLVDNFTGFPPLGVVLVAMLGIGVAERSGLLPTLLTRMLRVTPGMLLTPTVVLVGILSSLTLDAGYVVLPPLAAVLFHAAGRAPLAGLAAAFAGVSAGFSANLTITTVDVMLARFTQEAANLINADYRVADSANLFFMIASTVVLTGIGWWVTATQVEPRQLPSAADQDAAAGEDAASAKGLRAAGWAFAVTAALLLAATLVPGAPLHGEANGSARWINAIVPMLFVAFLIPGIAYGVAAGTIRSDHDVADLMAGIISDLGPYIVLAFVAAQFTEAFAYSRLGELIGISGGRVLAAANLPTPLLAVGFIIMAMAANLFVGSASTKYAFMAPVFVPMLMQAGLAPETTQAAYRIGDSVTNIITPMNPYWVIILGFMQRWRSNAGIGTLLVLMLPYALAFAAIWPALLALWMVLGIPLGPG